MPTDWIPFFTAGAGAAAALAGLIIVAMSVGVDQMITIPGMTSRAAAAIALLIGATVISLAGLLPVQGDVPFGIEVIVLGGVALWFTVDSAVKVIRGRASATVAEAVIKAGIGILPALAFVIGGVLLALGLAAGLWWIAGGIGGAIVVAVINAWVVLVEIKR
jgi:modulator of FtsH protease